MLIRQPPDEDLDYVTVTQIFYIGADRRKPLDVASKGFALSLDNCSQASHILGLPFVGYKNELQILVAIA